MPKSAIIETQRYQIGSGAADVREVNRYRLAALAFFWWGFADGLLHHSRGTTRDISCRGAFIVTEYPPPLGALVELDVFLPFIGGRSSAMRLRGQGKVLRVEPGEDRGFSVAACFASDVACSSGDFAKVQ